jgi:beta-xylosidase
MPDAGELVTSITMKVALQLAGSAALACWLVLTVRADEKAYLFSYFKGNGEDGLHLAASRDGLKWMPLNGDRPIVRPEVGHKLMRDPSIVRGPEGTFHMVWTTSWNNRVIGYARSRDLIEWSPQRALGVMEHEPTARNCWAPELFFDAPSGRFLIFWATTIPGRFPHTASSSEDEYNHRIYATTTRDFESFTPTQLFFDPGFNVIDAYLARAGERYVLFYKDETLKPEPRKVILMATAEKPEGPFETHGAPISAEDWVEGPSALRLGERWIVYYDAYRRGGYGAVASTDLEKWQDITPQLSMPTGMRHGTAFEVEPSILERLERIER